MTNDMKAFSLLTAILIGLAISPAQSAPDEGWGVVHIQAPTEKNVLHLVGITGRGQAIIRLPGEDTCKSFAVRMVAGGFWGREMRPRGEAVTLSLSGPRILRWFSKGGEIISDEYRVSTSRDDATAEIIIHAGLPVSAGFVIRPGGSPLAEFVGPTMRRRPCPVAPTSGPDAIPLAFHP